MNRPRQAIHAAARASMLAWTARVGPITAPALALREDSTVASARSRLAAAERRGLLRSWRPLAAEPALYTPTTVGLREAGLAGAGVTRVTAAGAQHAIACALAAAALQCCYPDHRVVGEAGLRREERTAGRALASAPLRGERGDRIVHRPDLVLWPLTGERSLPVAVEVELTVKAPRRLLSICVAWARCREVAGVLYLLSPAARGPVERAIERARASERIVLVALAALPGASPDAAAQTVPGAA